MEKTWRRIREFAVMRAYEEVRTSVERKMLGFLLDLAW